MQRIKLFFQESQQEFKRINWPTWQETVNLTVVVVVISLGLAFFLGAIDYALHYGLETIILK